jgi:hypothetical protein
MAATKTATKKTTAKKSTAKRSTATKPAAKKKTATSTKRTPKAAPPLTEREPLVVIEDAGFALAGLAQDVVEFAKVLPDKLQGYRGEFTRRAEEAPERVKNLREDAPERVRSTVEDVRGRVTKDLQVWIRSFEKTFDSKAAEGRKIAEQVRKDERVQRVLDQTGNTRSQVKAAVTSVRKTADVAVDAGRTAGRQQAENAASQVKAATTSARKSADTVVDVTAETIDR